MRRHPFIAAVILLLCGSGLVAQEKPKRITGDVVPGAEWEQVRPESVGYSSNKLEVLRAWVKTEDTASMLVVVQGRIIFSYGDVSHTSKIASARKSVLSMLYGNYVMNGTIDLDKTVKQIGLQDKQPFLPVEETATLRQLLAARSGIYLPTSSFGQKGYLPPRGSEEPGAHYLYSNWDFNAAGAAFEKLTGKNIYDALQTDMAVPLGMQDYVRAKQVKEADPLTNFDEYVMRLSARDMARLGLLMLDKGKWNGKQIIPEDWVNYSTSLATPFRDLNPSFLRNYASPERWGYSAALWWVWDAPDTLGGSYLGPWQGAYSAMGAGGTYITVFPGWDTVIVHQVDIDKNPKASVFPSSYTAMLGMIANSYCGHSCE